MIARDLAQQFEPPGDAVDPPLVDPAPPVVDPPVETENDRLRARIVELEAELRLARQPETLPDLKPLKRAAGLAGIDDETARRWCVDNIVAAKQIGKRWYVDPAALRAHLQLKNAK